MANQQKIYFAIRTTKQSLRYESFKKTIKAFVINKLFLMYSITRIVQFKKFSGCKRALNCEKYLIFNEAYLKKIEPNSNRQFGAYLIRLDRPLGETRQKTKFMSRLAYKSSDFAKSGLNYPKNY
ncbi:hypothetical protein BpHYR1_031218 [Brachionus plicatilis]|uniref:Uncharacterized protein n=1 Tax=Brachionus plicatilis TaxID=10195 RepID=A0A3M7Q8F4_BRAPC|nr:hypothetical protein BpHYR1_031218 [Brachionus plicatilis]